MVIDFKNSFDLFGLLLLLVSLLPVISYCEIHYRLPWFRGFLFKKEPEILFDVPHRVTGSRLPVMLMVKDSSKYPVHLDDVEIQFWNRDVMIKKHTIKFNKSLAQLFFSEIFMLDIKENMDHQFVVRCIVNIRINGSPKRVINHNLTRKYPSDFWVTANSERVKIPDNWLSGDLHVHSSYTEDQVEFGPELSSIIAVGKARGLDFVAVVDHSYDFDDVPGTFNFKDGNFTKWINFKKEVKDLNSKNPNFTIIPGFELSVDNGLGENVHMSVLNNDEIFPGSGDAMENYKSYPSEHYYRVLLDKLEPGALAYAAHPNVTQKFLHKKILKRGEWNSRDFTDKLAGYQILNGKKGDEFEKGKQVWVEKLLSGKKLQVFAGTDAHGNFNYNLSIKYPLLATEKTDEHIFGEFFSYIHSSSNDINSLIHGMKSGKVVISNGPFLGLQIHTGERLFDIGDEVSFLPEKIRILANSTGYFGKINTIRLIVGNCQEKNEQALELHDIDKINYDRELGIKLNINDCYIRAEMTTATGKIALTNPIWLKQGK
ncbi:MAG: CehA/McbA family metallohydrolase [Candidatus Marinimicrobia bacterium]|nr:CehA/McbA family metallohydrolase [Candidatus Neomarinimicrobiota bacterium]